MHPGRSAAGLPGVAFSPGIVAELPGRRGGVELPHDAAGFGIHGDANIAGAVTSTEINHAIVVGDRASQSTDGSFIDELLFPDQLARGLIQRNHPVVRHVGEHFPSAHCNSAAKLRTVAWIEGPLDLAGLSVDGENFALGRLDVENSIYSHGRGLLELLGRSTLEVV